MEAAQGAERTNLKGPEYHEGPGGELGGRGGGREGEAVTGPRRGGQGAGWGWEGKRNAEVTASEQGPQARLLLPAHTVPLPAGPGALLWSV